MTDEAYLACRRETGELGLLHVWQTGDGWRSQVSEGGIPQVLHATTLGGAMDEAMSQPYASFLPNDLGWEPITRTEYERAQMAECAADALSFANPFLETTYLGVTREGVLEELTLWVDWDDLPWYAWEMMGVHAAPVTGVLRAFDGDWQPVDGSQLPYDLGCESLDEYVRNIDVGDVGYWDGPDIVPDTPTATSAFAAVRRLSTFEDSVLSDYDHLTRRGRTDEWQGVLGDVLAKMGVDIDKVQGVTCGRAQ